MAISDKLNYLIETKQLFKDRLNSLGAEITSSTTFRNYLTWLDTFYGEVSDKTDISQNGVVGRTSQESTTGKNTLPQDKYIASRTINGITYTNNGDGTFDLNGTATANTSLRIIDVGIFNLESGQRYYLYSSVAYNSTTFNMSIVTTESGTQKFLIANGNYTPSTTPTSSRLQFYIASGDTVNVQNVKLMLVKGADDTSYEPYTNGPSPNPDYPQPINNLSGDVPYKVSGKNLLDIQSYLKQSDRGIIPTYNQDGSVTLSGTATTNYSNFARNISDVLEKNKTYTLSVIGTKNFAIGCRLFYSDNTNEDFNITSDNTYVNITPTKDVSDFRIYMYSLTSGTSYNSILYFQIEKGSTPTDYEPYISQTFNIPLGDIELCKIDTYKDRIKKSTGKNLCGIPNQSFNFNGVDITIEDGTITLNGTATTTETKYLQPIKTTTLKGTYTNNIIYISGTDPGSSLGNFNIRKESDSSVIQGSQANLYSNNSNSTITIEEDTNIIFGIYIRKNNVYTNYKFRPQLVKTATADYNYEPFGKVWYLEKKIGEISFSDSDLSSCSVNGMASTFVEYLSPIIDDIKPSMNEASQVSFSNITSKFRGTTSTKKIRFRISHEILGTTSSSTNAEAKTAFLNKMSNKTMICYYVLATPTTTEITQENYPSLYNALKQIQDYLTAYKINKEFILGYSSPEIEY